MEISHRHKFKRYRTYLSESPAHYESIMSKYGMPKKAHPPLEEDLLEKIMRQQRLDWKPRKWSLKNA